MSIIAQTTSGWPGNVKKIARYESAEAKKALHLAAKCVFPREHSPSLWFSNLFARSNSLAKIHVRCSRMSTGG
jgi:hypothetical protein